MIELEKLKLKMEWIPQLLNYLRPKISSQKPLLRLSPFLALADDLGALRALPLLPTGGNGHCFPLDANVPIKYDLVSYL